MRKRLWLFAICLTLAAPSAFAQPVSTFAPTSFPPGLIPLSGQWRTHSGDDIAWANPNFEDGSWQTTDLSQALVEPGWHWYRLRFQLSPRTPSLALLLDAPGDSSEVWIDGRSVPGLHIGSFWKIARNRWQLVPLPPSSHPIEVALRVFYPEVMEELWGKPALRVWLGGTEEAHFAAESDANRRFSVLLPSALINLAIVLAGLGSLALFFSQPSRLEYLWLALYLILGGLTSFIFAAVSGALLPYWVNDLIADPLTYPELAIQIEFTYAFIGHRLGRTLRMGEIALLAVIPISFLAFAGLFPARAYLLTETLSSLVVALGLPVLLFVYFRRGNREAGLLIFASLLPAAGIILADVGPLGQLLGWQRLASINNAGLALGPVLLSWPDLAGAVFLLVIGALMFRRFNRVSTEQARAAAELEAAQRVQSLLLSSTQSSGALFHIDTVYRPAQKVGGDFFHTAQIQGRTRIVIGDVSGKGLGAAMLVSALVGALDAIAFVEPPAVLHALNSLLLNRQKDGFATCLVVLVDISGAVTIANAGHLPPYRNGEEMPASSGLPLGLLAEVGYEAIGFELAAGDRLTLVTDGVVEARDAKGELLGFERMAVLASLPAAEIAEAAQRWGQEDDITVLTVALTAHQQEATA